MGANQVTLAPALRTRRLVLPPALENSQNVRWGLSHRLLMSFGLTHAESVKLQNQALQLAKGYEFARFLAAPRDRALPAFELTERWPERLEERHDYPDIGVFHFDCRIWFSAEDRAIVREFAAWLRGQRRLLGFRKWGRVARKVSSFERDLVVYALSETDGWSTAEIEAQLAHMRLPSLACSRRTDLKAAVASVRRKIRKDLRLAKTGTVPARR